MVFSVTRSTRYFWGSVFSTNLNAHRSGGGLSNTLRRGCPALLTGRPRAWERVERARWQRCRGSLVKNYERI